MNKRIKELTEQAVVAVDVVTGNEALDDELAKMYIPDCFAEKFAELIIRECTDRCGSQADQRNILKSFGLEVESNIKYPSPERHWSIKSQYDREYNLPKGEQNEPKN